MYLHYSLHSTKQQRRQNRAKNAPKMRFSSKTNNRRNFVSGRSSRGSQRPEKTLRMEGFPEKGEVYAAYPASSMILL